MLHVYIGYDLREHEAYEVCRFSIERRASVPVAIKPLKHRELRAAKLFTRPWTVSEEGQFIDQRDGKPFSTEFSHSRFLTPILARQDGADWALFCDCDFLFVDDVAKLLQIADPSKAAMCVQHVHEPPEGVKMDGVLQTRYRRKNWSSFILFNVKHLANARLTPFAVNYQPGSWLHALGWLDDNEIGVLPEGWNHLVGISSGSGLISAIHFTEGLPTMAGYEDVPFAEAWREELATMKRACGDL